MERGTTATPTFADADVRRRELTERQLHVLRLVAEGHTNWEIGEALGITLDGAKWNVSELLSKLGLNSREELADYWRWHNRRSARLGRAFRGLVGLPVLKIAGGLATATAVVGIAVFAWMVFRQAEDPLAKVPPFTMVAQFSVTNVPAHGSIQLSAPPPQDRKSIIRYYFTDATHSGSEMETIEPAIDAGTIVTEAQNGSSRIYNSNTNTYTVTQSTLRLGVPPPHALSLGPLAFDNLQAFLDSYNNDPKSGVRAETVGNEVVLGRNTTIVEERSTQLGINGHEPERTHLWVDTERMFVMRAASVPEQDTPATLSMEATSLDYGLAVADVAPFSIPSDAREVTEPDKPIMRDQPSGGTAQQWPMSVPAGFLAASYAPSGYLWTPGSGNTAPGYDALASIDDTFAQASSAGGAYLRIEQRKRADGLPAALQTTDTTTVNGHPAYRGVSGTAKTLAWAQDGIAILLTADALPYAELERVANSMTLR